MSPHPRSVWLAMALAALTLWAVALGHAQDTPDDVASAQVAPHQVIIDPSLVYVALIGRGYPNLFPPPVEARREGWLRKWSESQLPNDCLALSGTLYYLEREPGEAGWLAAVVETEHVPELELEVHLDEKVAISGTAEFFSAACNFPRLYAHSLEVVDPGPDVSLKR